MKKCFFIFTLLLGVSSVFIEAKAQAGEAEYPELDRDYDYNEVNQDYESDEPIDYYDFGNEPGYIPRVPRDSTITIMTYNLWIGNKRNFEAHRELIERSRADVIAVQEIRGKNKFHRIVVDENIYGGYFCQTDKKGGYKYGIGVMWKNSFGAPEKVTERTINVSGSIGETDEKRAYMIAEFNDFCFISTHYSLNYDKRIEMTNKILDEDIVKKYQAEGKPVYIAGDMNENANAKKENGEKRESIDTFENAGFEVLNKLTLEHSTKDGLHIDLILEHNENPGRAVIDRGIPYFIPIGLNDGWINKVSDHFPYFVKVKFK